MYKQRCINAKKNNIVFHQGSIGRLDKCKLLGHTNGLPWYDVTCKNDKTKEETELYEIHGNMDLIEKTLQKLFGIHYEKELNE